MSRKSRLPWLALTAAVLALDLWSKAAVGRYPPPPDENTPPMRAQEGVVVVQDWIELRPSWNPGALFGLGQDHATILLILTCLAVPIVLGWVFWPARVSRWENAGKLLILGGALGNLYDRITFGAVRDFINVYYGTMDAPAGEVADHWPTFNVADSALVTGVILLLFLSFRETWRERKSGKAAA